MKLIDCLLREFPELDRKTATGLIMRGDVLIDDRAVTSPALELHGGRIRIRGEIHRSESRGKAKLAPALEASGMDCEDRVCMDLGAADGGFTRVLLEAGAAKVYAVDVAYGVLAAELRNDERIIVLERTNARLLGKEQVPEPVGRIVGDLSFISWSAVLPAVLGVAASDAELLLLVKPQFELAAAGRDDLLEQGIVTSHTAIRDCLAELLATWQNNGVEPHGVFRAGITGRKGNQEYFVHLLRGAGGNLNAYLELIDKALMGVSG